MKVIITGVPGTGKTSVANALSKKLKMPVTHISAFAKQKKLIIGREKGADIVDIKKLHTALEKVDGIIEGHLACEFPLRNAVVIVLRCEPRILEKRMRKRGYSKEKIAENLECEALDYCTQLAEKNYKKVFEIDTTNKTVAETIKKCVQIVRGKGVSERVDFSSHLLGAVFVLLIVGFAAAFEIDYVNYAVTDGRIQFDPGLPKNASRYFEVPNISVSGINYSIDVFAPENNELVLYAGEIADLQKDAAYITTNGYTVTSIVGLSSGGVPIAFITVSKGGEQEIFALRAMERHEFFDGDVFIFVESVTAEAYIGENRVTGAVTMFVSPEYVRIGDIYFLETGYSIEVDDIKNDSAVLIATNPNNQKQAAEIKVMQGAIFFDGNASAYLLSIDERAHLRIDGAIELENVSFDDKHILSADMDGNESGQVRITKEEKPLERNIVFEIVQRIFDVFKSVAMHA